MSKYTGLTASENNYYEPSAKVLQEYSRLALPYMKLETVTLGSFDIGITCINGVYLLRLYALDLQFENK